MRCRKPGNSGKRWLAVAACLWLAGSAAGQQIHRNGFDGKQPYWTKGEGNVEVREKSHSITDATAHRGTTSEQLILDIDQGKDLNNFVHYIYTTPQAVVTEETTAGVHVRSSRPGVQLFARLVLPRERDPKNIEEPLTVLLPGDTLKITKTWQRLDLPRPKKLVSDAQQKLRTDLRKDVDVTGAYIDRLVLNVYAGPGVLELQIDDLEISPVSAASVPPPSVGGGDRPLVPSAIPTKNTRGQLVKFENSRIRVDGKPFFFRAIRYTGGDLKELKDKGFNTLYVDAGTPQRVLDEAIGHGFWLVPQVPLIGDSATVNGQLTSRGPATSETAYTLKEAEGLTTALTRFNAGDGVLFWDLGAGRVAEQFATVSRTADAIRAADPHRPRSADVYDGFRKYSTQLELIGTHRKPLMTSLEPQAYRDYLTQRSRLAGDGVFMWSWVQATAGENVLKALFNKDNPDDLVEGFAPSPEQIRLVAYTGIASGSRGLAFGSDKFLQDPQRGRDRLLMMALLNAELTMLEPVLQTIRGGATWIDTSDKNVKAAVLRGERGVLVIPIWMGQGSQFVPPQGAVARLTMVVPMIPDGMSPWQIGPGRVQALDHEEKETVGGTRLVIPEFDLTTAVVFTHDLNKDGLVARWQDHARKVGKQSAEWAVELANLELEKMKRLHAELEAVAPELPEAGRLLWDAQTRLDKAREHMLAKDDKTAYMEATRSLRPLRILQRAQWEVAIKSLDMPTSSPYTISYQTLHRHWRLQEELRGLGIGPNALADGDFESVNRTITRTSVGGDSQLPQGWSKQEFTLDQVKLDLRLVSGASARVPLPPKIEPKKPPKFQPSSKSRIPEKSDPPQPELGANVLCMEVTPKEQQTPSGGKAYAPSVLERTFLAVHSPPVRMHPGEWVRFSGWIYLPAPIKGSADGLMFYDSVGGESLGVRLTDVTVGWKQFHLYRRVPESGTVWMTVALTGLGTVFIDDLRIEPFQAGKVDGSLREPPLSEAKRVESDQKPPR